MFISTQLKIASISVPLVFLLGCWGSDDDYSVSSEFVSNSQIYTTIEVYSEGNDEIYVAAQLTKDIPPNDNSPDDIFIRLNHEDSLWLSAGESIEDINLGDDLFSALEQLDKTQVKLERSRDYLGYFFGSRIRYGNYWYFGSLPQSAENNYTVALIRDEDFSVKSSSVNMPNDFSIVSPSPYESLSRSSDNILIEWTAVAPNPIIEIEVSSSCINGDYENYSFTLSNDTGSALISAGELESEFLSGECVSHIEVVKTQIGQFDSDFAGGRITAHQIRAITITTTD